MMEMNAETHAALYHAEKFIIALRQEVYLALSSTDQKTASADQLEKLLKEKITEYQKAGLVSHRLTWEIENTYSEIEKLRTSE